ncbi:MAG: hypothetical protein IKV59_01775 [Lachnospiraceae bacterium]|nr:hypothetical protein [Lachnospiraceae bacterium]
MEATFSYSVIQNASIEIRDFVNEGLNDVSKNKLLDFDDVFDEIEARYSANE